MFYSHCLLSKKGPLRAIWVAAYCHKMLKKDQVAETDISSSIDEIMLNEFTIAYRVLGYLLLGVVRIYSKKVEYLYHDCNEILTKINNYVLTRRDHPPKEAMCASYLSITLPDKFELDAFNMEILEDRGGGSVRPFQQITLEETWKETRNGHYTPKKHHHGEDVTCLETSSAVHTPVEDVLSPHMMDTDTLASSSHTLASLERSVEKLQGNEFLEEECRDFDLFGGAVEPLDFDTRFSDIYNQEDWINLLEITPPDPGRSHLLSEGHPVVTPTVDGTSEFLCVSGSATPEFMVIHTPMKEQWRLQSSRKRKHLFDETIVLSNEVVRQNLHDSSRLVCKRRKAPLASLDAWKACKIANLCQNFMEPLIPCMSSQLKDLFYKTKFKNPEPVEAAERLIKSRDEGSGTPSKCSEQKAISEPVYHSEFVSFVESPTTGKSDKLGSITSVATTGDEPSAVETQDIGLNLMEEEIGPREEDNQYPDGWSVRTRTVAKYIRKSFLNLKDQSKEEVLNLALVLEGKARKGSARFFFEILALKSMGLVDVKQNTPYGDILVQKTLQIETIL